MIREKVISAKEWVEELAKRWQRGDETAIDEFLDDVLEIQRQQSLTQDGWITTGYTFVLAMGGPTIWVETTGVIKGYWDRDSYEEPLTRIAEEFLKEVGKIVEGGY